MRKKSQLRPRLLWGALLAIFSIITATAACSKSDSQAGNELRAIDHSYPLYAQLLESYVGESRVDYSGLKADHGILDSLVLLVANADLSAASKQQRLAFYINAYNILTLRSIVDAYPVNSIKDIDDVWKKKWRVAGRELSIDAIENEVLRKEFNEPRIHVAINCASISCPPLMARPYIADSCDTQLDAASETFATTERYNQISVDQKQAKLSQIFEWFGGDFVEEYYDADRFAGPAKKQNAALMFIILHHPTSEQAGLLIDNYDVTYLEYNWGLNDIDKSDE